MKSQPLNHKDFIGWLSIINILESYSRIKILNLIFELHQNSVSVL